MSSLNIKLFFSGGRSSRKRILIAAVNALMDLKLKMGQFDDGTGVDNTMLLGKMITTDWNKPID